MPEPKGEIMMVERDILIDSLPVEIKVKIIETLTVIQKPVVLTASYSYGWDYTSTNYLIGLEEI